MSGWTKATGPAVALRMENVDTDQIIPARFMSAPRSAGYGRFLFHDLREGNPDFAVAKGTTILVSGRNFGAGSSREAAVYALVDAGIRAVVAPSFGDIFAANAVNNGLLPAQVSAEDAARLMDRLPAEAQADIEAGEVRVGDLAVPFTLDPVWRTKIVNGWDDIDLTLGERDAIAAFRAGYEDRYPWTRPARVAAV